MEDETLSLTRRAFMQTAAGSAAAGVAGAWAVASALTAIRAPSVIEVDNARRFAGQVALITGATSGIGAAAAKLFAQEGAKVAFCGRRVERGRSVEQSIRNMGGEATYIRADVRIEEEVSTFIEAAVQRYGGLDICFNNAGITIEKVLHEMTAAEWDDVVSTNLRGNFLALKYEIPHLIRRGGGIVLVTSSSNAIATAEKRGAYASTKRGLVGFVQAAAQDYAPHNIRINALLPGTTDTELVRRAAGMLGAPDGVWEEAQRIWSKTNIDVAHRMASPEEIARFAVAMASPEFTYLTGAQLVVDGGKTAHG